MFPQIQMTYEGRFSITTLSIAFLVKMVFYGYRRNSTGTVNIRITSRFVSAISRAYICIVRIQPYGRRKLSLGVRWFGNSHDISLKSVFTIVH